MENLKTKMVRNCNRQTEDDLSGPESDGQDNFTYLMCDPDYENDEEEANFVWAGLQLCLQGCPKGAPSTAKGQTVLQAEACSGKERQN